MASIEPRKAKNGVVTWYVRFRVEGRKNPVKERFSSSAEAEKFKRLVEKVGGKAAREARDASTGTLESIPTLAEWFDTYLEDIAAHSARGTPYGYRGAAERTWLPVLGDLPVTSITRADVTRWVSKARSQETARSAAARKKAIDAGVDAPEPVHLSIKSIRNAHGVLSGCLNAAVLAGHIPANPARGVRLPKDEQTTQREMDIFTTEEWSRLLTALPERWRPLFHFLMGTAARIGEATALQVRDLDLDLKAVHIRRAWKKDAGGRVYLGAPKSRRGNRTILVGDSVVEALRPLVEGKTDPESLVFTGVRGFRVDTHRLRSEVWIPAMKAAKIEKPLTFHSIRHTSASWQLMAGVAPQVVQHRLGHESLATTSKVYAHLLTDEQVSAVNVLDGKVAPRLPA